MNKRIKQKDNGLRYNCCGYQGYDSHTIDNNSNTLYTIYNEFDQRYFYKMMKEGVYREIEEGIIIQIKAFIEGLLNLQADELCNAKYYKHSKDRRDFRNGSRKRYLLTNYGQIIVNVPRLRGQSVGKGIIERYRQRSKYIDKTISEMYFKGISTREIKKTINKMFGKDYHISAQTVSNITKKIDEEVSKWRNRVIEDNYPIIYLDGVYLNVKSPDKSKRRCVLVCMGISSEGKSEILGYKVAFYGESECAWFEFINELYHRGLYGKNTRLCVIDGNLGLRNAINFVWPFVKIQRCWVHKARNVLSYVGMRYRKECGEDLRRIYNAKDIDEARENYKYFCRKWEILYPKAVRCLEKDLDELMIFYGYERIYWKLIRTTNKIERVFREIRRRSNNIGVFNNVKSLERIIYYKFREYNERSDNRKKIKMDKFLEKSKDLSNQIYTQILT